MPNDREKPLAPNVKGGPTHTPFRKPLVSDGLCAFEIVNGNLIQYEGEFLVTYHNCAEDRDGEWAIDLVNCKMVTWE